MQSVLIYITLDRTSEFIKYNMMDHQFQEKHLIKVRIF